MRRFACLIILLSSPATLAAPLRAPSHLLQATPHPFDRPALLALAGSALAALGGLTILAGRQHRLSVKPEFTRGPMAALEMKF